MWQLVPGGRPLKSNRMLPPRRSATYLEACACVSVVCSRGQLVLEQKAITKPVISVAAYNATGSSQEWPMLLSKSKEAHQSMELGRWRTCTQTAQPPIP